MNKSHDASQDSIMMSPTGLRHADNLAKGSADLKEQLRLLMRDSPGSFVARNLLYDNDDEDNEGEDEGEGAGPGSTSRGGKLHLSSPMLPLHPKNSPTPSLTPTNAGSNLSDEAGTKVSGDTKEDLEKLVAGEIIFEARIRELEGECKRYRGVIEELEGRVLAETMLKEDAQEELRVKKEKMSQRRLVGNAQMRPQ